MAGALGGLLIHLSVLRAPIADLTRAAGHPPTAGKLALVVTVSALLAIGAGEALHWIFARTAEAGARNRDRAV